MSKWWYWYTFQDITCRKVIYYFELTVVCRRTICFGVCLFWTYIQPYHIPLFIFTLRGDKGSMLTYKYQHTLEEDYSDHMQSLGWQPTSCVSWWLIWWFASFRKSMVKHDTKWPYWNKVSLNNTNQPHPLSCVFPSVYYTKQWFIVNLLLFVV